MTSDLPGQEAETAAREAIRLDPRNATGYAALAQIQLFATATSRPAKILYKQALALDPNEPDVLDDAQQ